MFFYPSALKAGWVLSFACVRLSFRATRDTFEMWWHWNWWVIHVINPIWQINKHCHSNINIYPYAQIGKMSTEENRNVHIYSGFFRANTGIKYPWVWHDFEYQGNWINYWTCPTTAKLLMFSRLSWKQIERTTYFMFVNGYGTHVHVKRTVVL